MIATFYAIIMTFELVIPTFDLLIMTFICHNFNNFFSITYLSLYLIVSYFDFIVFDLLMLYFLRSCDLFSLSFKTQSSYYYHFDFFFYHMLITTHIIISNNYFLILTF